MSHEILASHITTEKLFFQRHPNLREQSKIRHAITIAREPAEVFSFIRDLSNLLKVLKGIESVAPITDERSHWNIRLKTGLNFEWDVAIHAESPNEMIAWTNLVNSHARSIGEIWLSRASKNLGTVLTFQMDYSVPGGKLAEWFAFLGGEAPETLVLINLKRLKAYLEVGEIATTEGQPQGADEERLTSPPLDLSIPYNLHH